MKKTWIAALCLALAALIAPAQAGDFPDRTITVICPYGAGGGTDVIMRALADTAARLSGVNIVVNNVTGGNGALGVMTMMQAEPDGYTIGSCSGEWISLKELSLAPEDYDYNNAERIMHYNFDSAAIIVPAESPYGTLDDLIAAAKADPEGIALGVTAAGGAHHLTMLLFQERAGVKFNILPYSEGAAGVNAALMGGHVDIGSVGPAEAAAQLEAGAVRMLAIASENRMPSHPDVPTFKELGFDVVYGSWRALAAPKGTPADRIAVLEDLFVRAAQQPEFVEFCNKGGFTIDLLNKADFEPRFASQEKLVKEVSQLYLRNQ